MRRACRSLAVLPTARGGRAAVSLSQSPVGQSREELERELARVADAPPAGTWVGSLRAAKKSARKGGEHQSSFQLAEGGAAGADTASSGLPGFRVLHAPSEVPTRARGAPVAVTVVCRTDEVTDDQSSMSCMERGHADRDTVTERDPKSHPRRQLAGGPSAA